MQKAWSLAWAFLGGGGTFRRWNLLGRNWSWVVCLEGDIGALVSSFSLFLPDLHEVCSFILLHIPCHGIGLYHGPKSMNSSDHGV
jgi:hypothetical protein